MHVWWRKNSFKQGGAMSKTKIQAMQTAKPPPKYVRCLRRKGRMPRRLPAGAGPAIAGVRRETLPLSGMTHRGARAEDLSAAIGRLS
jgi:hypothetical protein